MQAQITEALEEQVKGLRCDSLKGAGPALPVSRSSREGPADNADGHLPSADKMSLIWTNLEKEAQGHLQHSPPMRWRETLCSLTDWV